MLFLALRDYPGQVTLNREYRVILIDVRVIGEDRHQAYLSATKDKSCLLRLMEVVELLT